MMLLIKSLCWIYKENLEKLKESDFIFDSVQLLYYTFHNCGGLGGSYIDSPDWIKKKKAPINKKIQTMFFQYTTTVTLNYEEIESHPERVSNVKPFLNRYDWEEINYTSKTDNW